MMMMRKQDFSGKRPGWMQISANPLSQIIIELLFESLAPSQVKLFDNKTELNYNDRTLPQARIGGL
jgi:hypothetical protein